MDSVTHRARGGLENGPPTGQLPPRVCEDGSRPSESLRLNLRLSIGVVMQGGLG